jgi:glutamate-1-semialdehyde 2,1-aminomutase
VALGGEGALSANRELFERAQRVIPGGVNSPVRGFGAVGGTPLFLASGKGSRVRDAEGREYLDFLGSWGPLILGHAPPAVEAALARAIQGGTSFGAPTEREVELAELVRAMVPSMEMVRLTSSGTEAAMSAARLARGFTGRDHLIKFAGSYHGHSDGFLAKAGSGSLTLGVPSSPGVPAAVAALTLNARYNDLGSVERLLSSLPGRVAAVIVEPVAGNMGVVPPGPGFLSGLRRLCDGAGALLIFDEVITGFRVAPGGAQELYGVRPDHTVLGKVLGGGLPIAAFGGRREILERLAPTGPVYQAGTLSGNPLATAAGLATLSALRDGSVHRRLEALGGRLEAGLRKAIAASGVEACVNRVGSMLTLFFTRGPVVDLDSLEGVRTDRYGRFFHGLLDRGVYFPPAQYETLFVSAAHTEEEIDRAVEAAGEALRELNG